MGYYAGGFGATQLGFMIPEVIIIFLCLFFSKKVLNAEDDYQIKPSRYFFSISLIVFSFMVMLFMCGSVNVHIQQYIQDTNITNLYNYFYTGLLYIFYIMTGFQIVMFLAYLGQRKKVKDD